MACGVRSIRFHLGGSAMVAIAETTENPVVLDYLNALAHVLGRVPGEPLAQAIELLLEARSVGRRVYVMGNGGSSATASHLVSDLVKGAHVPGFRPFRAFSLTDNVPLLTAWSNDSAYECALAEQIEALV